MPRLAFADCFIAVWVILSNSSSPRAAKVIMSIGKSLSIFHRAGNIRDTSIQPAFQTRHDSNNSLTDKGKRGYTHLFASGPLILAKPRSK